MEVVCNSCGARYRFDAAAIPKSGYQAQCTQCSSVFFVAPEPEPLSSVTCKHCGAIYQFPVSSIPKAGYSAECSHCHQVFFVSPAGIQPEIPAPQAASPQTLAQTLKPTPMLAELSPVPFGSRRELHDTPEGAGLKIGTPPTDFKLPTTKPALSPSRQVTNSQATVPVGDPRYSNNRVASSNTGSSTKTNPGWGSSTDVLALSQALGEPLPAPEGVSIHAVFEHIAARRRRRLWLFLLGIFGVGIILTLLWFKIPNTSKTLLPKDRPIQVESPTTKIIPESKNSGGPPSLDANSNTNQLAPRDLGQEPVPAENQVVKPPAPKKKPKARRRR